MARQKLVVGTYGDISCTQRANGTWLARARYCDVDGVVLEYRTSGETKKQGTGQPQGILRRARRLRHIRQLDEYTDIAALRDVSPHAFRGTVATEIDEVYDADAAKDQLGTSKTVTERHYVDRRLLVPDYRAERPVSPLRATRRPTGRSSRSGGVSTPGSGAVANPRCAQSAQGWRPYDGGGMHDPSSVTGGHFDHLHWTAEA